MMIFNSPAVNCFDICDNSVDENLVVYHYTSAEAFFSIINNSCIRFADLKYMNDKSEKIFFIKRLIEFYDNNKLNYPEFCQVVDILLKGNDYNLLKQSAVNNVVFNDIKYYPYKPVRTFILCSCCEADSLNMWNYYVKNSQYSGYNIGFSVFRFLKTFDTDKYLSYDKFFVDYGKIIYDIKEQYNKIELLAQQIERNIVQNDRTEKIYKSAALDLRRYIDTKGVFFKSDKFSQEKEFRISINADVEILKNINHSKNNFIGENNKKIKEGFSVKNGLIVPHLEITIPDNSISRITMSPMTEYKIAKESIKELLEIKGFKNKLNNSIPICHSEIPIRF